MIEIKSEHEIELIRESGRIVKLILENLKKETRPGVTTLSLESIAKDVMAAHGAKSAFKDFRGYPAYICTSINEQVVHGIPDKTVLKSGDIVSIDIGIEKDGYFADGAMTFAIGKISQNALRLMKVAEESLYRGIEKAVEGNRLFDISYAIQQHVESHGYSVVRDFVGHGIGKKLHEDPAIPNFGKPDTGPRLKNGMVLAIEPMINEGAYDVEILDDGWTAVAKDRLLSAHFEHTICVTGSESIILT